jgi:hypothetical protein
VLFAAWAIASDAPQLGQLWHTYGVNPYYSGGDFGVDRDWQAVTFADRMKYMSFGIVASPGVRCASPSGDASGSRVLTAAAAPQPLKTSDAVIAALCFFGNLLFVVIGGWLVLIRPMPITWAFLVFGTLWGPADWFFSIALLPPLLGIIQMVVFTLLAGAAMWALLYFSLVFPSGAIGPLKQFLARWSWLAWPVVTLHFNAWWSTFALFGIVDQPWLYRLGDVVMGLMLLGSIVAMGHTFVVSRGLDRQRIKWVFASFALGIFPLVLFFIFFTFDQAVPVWITDIGFLMTIFLPFAFAYTVIVHRILDVNFIVSRALVYGILTSLIVAIFGLIDWFVGKVLAQTQLALIAEIAAAIGLGFGLNGLHAKLDGLIDATLFRERHRAEKHLARVANAVAHVGTLEAVEDMLVSEPAGALRLASAAVFLADESGVFKRTAAVHWREDDTAELGIDDRLVAFLRAEQNALSVDETGWTQRDLPHGAARPIVAVPILVRHELRAVALYGAHVSGEAIDPDELKLIEKIAAMSSAAIDHLEAIELRRQNEALSLELAWYRTNAGPAAP